MKKRIFLILLALMLTLNLGLIGCGGERVPEYSLTVSSTEGGEITTPGESSSVYGEGTEVPIVALPHTGYRFVEWTGDVGTVANVNAASTTITMNGNCSITANFVVQYVLTIDSTGGGEVAIPGEGTFTYDAGEVVDLAAEPGEGYRFSSWTGDLATIADISAASTAIAVNGDYSITANFEEEEVHFPDANLEAAIREETGKSTGPIYRSDLEGLTHLMAHQRGIADLTGLEYCTNLIQPWLWGNQISDISPLTDLTSVIVLSVGENDISDISPLANLTNLRELWIDSNRVSDISSLSGLTKLTELYLWVNDISDIGPLANLTNLTRLDLGDNQISDIYPLVQNDGLGEGDVVYLLGNPLSSDSVSIYIPELEARGVIVEY